MSLLPSSTSIGSTAKKSTPAAANAWATYLGDRGQGYLRSNWILNGDFESEFSKSPFDWSIDRVDDIEADRDSEVKRSGGYSLRIRLTGKRNLSMVPVSQRIAVTPGRYQFEAYVKTEGLTTGQGISLSLTDAEGASFPKIVTEPLLGTNEWHKLTATFCAGPKTKLVALNVVRQPSLRFDNLIKGTLWIDSVKLTKLGDGREGDS